MTAETRGALWRQLSDAGLVQGDMPEQTAPASPWFVRAMLGVAGWIGALFLLGFVGAGLAFVFDSGSSALVVGVLCCSASYAIFAKGGRNELASQFGLAVSLAGQVMVIFGLHEVGDFAFDSPVFFLLVAAFEGLLAYLLNGFVHRVWSSFAMAIAFAFAVNRMGLYGLGTALVGASMATVWLNQTAWAARGTLWRAIGWGLAFAFIQPMTAFGDLQLWSSSTNAPAIDLFWLYWIKSLLIIGVLLYVVYRLLGRYGISPADRAGWSSLAAAAIVGAATLRAPGITSSLLIALLGFGVMSRSLLGVGIVALLAYLSHFYYSLQATLLVKSIALVGTGVVLIGLRFVMTTMFGADEDSNGGDHA